MDFKAPTELQFTREKYARALRAIGQDLADLYPDRLEIETDGDNFIARDRTRALIRQQSNGKLKRLRKLWHRLSEPDPEATNCEFERTYTPQAIDRLDEIGTLRRSGTSAKPDLYSIAEKLRMVGRIVDDKRAEFLKLCQDDQSVTFHYRDKQ